MSARDYLRDLTRAAHDRVDAAYGTYALDDADGYRRFLTAHAAAYLPIEQALDDAGAADLIPGWAERRRADALRADLADLGAQVPDAIDPPHFDSAEAVAGGAYVLEGSRLGGAVLSKSVPDTLPSRFLAPSRDSGWPRFVASVERILYSRVQQISAGEAALQTFARFEEAARLWKNETR